MIDIEAEKRALFEREKWFRRAGRGYTTSEESLRRAEQDVRFYIERIEEARLCGLPSSKVNDLVREAEIYQGIYDDLRTEVAELLSRDAA